MKKILISFILPVLLIAFVFSSSSRADVPESKDPIKIVIMGYSGDNIIMQIYGELISKLGYNIEYTPADYIGQFAGMKSGDLHIGSPGWDTTAKDVMADAWGSGNVLNMGNIGISVFEDWWYDPKANFPIINNLIDMGVLGSSYRTTDSILWLLCQARDKA